MDTIKYIIHTTLAGIIVLFIGWLCKKVIKLILKIKPKKYNKEKEGIITIIKNNITDPVLRRNPGFVVEEKSEYTENILKELEDEKIIMKYEKNGVKMNRNHDNNLYRIVTPSFRSKILSSK